MAADYFVTGPHIDHKVLRVVVCHACMLGSVWGSMAVDTGPVQAYTGLCGGPCSTVDLIAITRVNMIVV